MNRFLTLVFGICLLCAGCSTPGEKQFWHNAGTGAATVWHAAGPAALTVSQVVANAVLTGVFMKAESTQDLQDKGDKLDSLAAGLRTLQTDTGGVLSPQVIAATVLPFTDPTKTHWSVLANSVATAVTTSPLPQNQALEQAATTLNTMAAATRPPAVPTTPQS